MSNPTFYDAVALDSEEFTFKARGIMVAVANTIRRAIMSEIPTYTIAPDTIQMKNNNNTSPWETDLITHQLVFLPLLQKTLSEKDINMLELSLDAKNETKSYRWVLAGEIVIRNKETNEQIPTELVVQSVKTPLFNLGPNQEVNLIASFEFMTKVELDGTPMAARHQGGTVGYEYIADEKDRSVIPPEIKFNVSIHTGLDPKEHIQFAFQMIIDRLKTIYQSIDEGKFYSQMNKDHRYDFILMGETHTIGNLIARWINRHDTNAFCAYRDTRDRKAITIDYGLFKYAPPLLQASEVDVDLKELVDKSLSAIDPAKEFEQRTATVKTLLGHVDRLTKYIESLLEQWNKIKIKKA